MRLTISWEMMKSLTKSSAGLLMIVIGSAKLRDASVVDDEHAVRERERLFRVMRHNERRELELAGDRTDALLDGFLDEGRPKPRAVRRAAECEA